ncbi:MAG: hypothetical protein KAU49_02820, partial [Candidatus Krumholzibacteria bacterium]|nr:hypothetical protein [Candidatus Krumholzibacteria bacterium]
MKDINWQKGNSIWNGRILIPLYVILTVIYILFFNYRPVGAGLVFLFDFCYLVILPGFTLSRLILNRTPPWLEASTSLLFGISLFYCLLLLSSLTGLRISALGIIIPILEFGLIVFGTTIMYRRPQSIPVVSDKGNDRTGLIFLVIILIACTILILLAGDPLLYTGDSQDHI